MDIQKCIDIARLLAKKLTGSITPEENQQLDEWRLADRRHQELADKLTDEKDYLVHQQELEQFPPAERWEQVEQTIRKQNHRSPFATRRWIAAAAAAVLPCRTARNERWNGPFPGTGHHTPQRPVSQPVASHGQRCEIILQKQVPAGL